MKDDVRDPGTDNAGATDEPVSEMPAAEGAGSPDVEQFAAETAESELLAPAGTMGYKERWLRAEADLQNFRRRAARDREESVRASEDRILLEMLDVLDDLERAIAALTPEQAGESWAQGVSLTAQRLRDALARSGVKAMDVVGQPFRPEDHEALLEVAAPEGVAPGSVAQEVRRGYRRGDRPLRAARVVVARADG